MLTRLNQNSLDRRRKSTSSMPTPFPGWTDNRDVFDFVVVDFPDPTNYSLGKLYTTAFYRLLAKHVSASGAGRGAEHVAAVCAAVLLVHRRNA